VRCKVVQCVDNMRFSKKDLRWDQKGSVLSQRISSVTKDQFCHKGSVFSLAAGCSVAQCDAAWYSGLQSGAEWCRVVPNVDNMQLS